MAASGARIAIRSPLVGTVVSIDVAIGDAVRPGQSIAVIESMKMHHVVKAACHGLVRSIEVSQDDTLEDGEAIAFIEQTAGETAAPVSIEAADPDAIRADLAEVRARHAFGLDENRPDAVARRRKTGQRTARENIADLVDPGSFIEYGALTLAAQRRRRPLDELMRMSPADGLVAGIGAINGTLFDEAHARSLVMAYDYTVLAGTQGLMNHKKTDRMLGLAAQWKLPIVWFVEGGGGRPGDTDAVAASWLDTPSFARFAALSGVAPRIGIVSGRCFAGNAVFYGCCDVTIATKNSNIGMAGPAMIEGGGLGVFAPEDVGPIEVNAANGVVDLVADDEAHAVRQTKQLLAYFQGEVKGWSCGDQRALRDAIPEDRLRVYDIRVVIDALADTGSVLELRRAYGSGMITGFIRIEGRPLGLIANDPKHLGGAIDAEGAEKAARFMQLCDAFDVPILSLCDTPGFMVGPESEETAPVRRGSRMFIVAASMAVPIFTVVLRKGYGLGAQAMAGGGFHSPFFTIAWPTSEFGAMGLEGAVRLAYRKDLAAQPEGVARDALFNKLVGELYEAGKGISVASFLEIDAVIDPVETRAWIVRGLKSVPARETKDGKRRPMIDPW
ncbi:MAG: carboxyl transferase domain-containing protein [Burkholderiales bacterium]